MTYRPELDGIRALAVAAVVLAHAGAPLPGGHLGVDMFFVLSGYLITAHILRDLAAGTFQLRAFYERRARRILPALAIVALACLPTAWVLLPPVAMQQFGQGLVAISVFASNLLFWHQAGYFAPAAAENPLIHTWSLAIEEQFYLLFPLAMLVLWRHARKAVAWVLAGLCLLSLGAFAIVWGTDGNSAFYLLPFRVWELMAGALVAWIQRGRGVESHPVGALLGFALMLAALIWGDHHGGAAWAWNVTVVIGTALLVHCAHGEGLIVRVLSIGPVRTLGLISYSTYLWHQPVFAFARVGQIEPLSWLAMAGLIGLVLVLAGLTWRFVEQPWRKAAPTPYRLWGAGALVGGLVMFGLAAHLTQGLATPRFSPEQRQLFASAVPSPTRARCHGSAGHFKSCTHGAQVAPGWAVIGDSHAVELSYALGEALARRGQSVLHASASACPPAVDPNGQAADCVKWLGQALDQLKTRPDVHTLMLVWRHGLYLSGDYPHALPCPEYAAKLRSIVVDLTASGREVVVLAPVPELPRDIALHVRDWTADGRALPALLWKDHRERHFALLELMETLPATILDPTAALCDAVWCYAATGGKAAYFDDDHLSLSGARRVIAPLVELGMGTEPRSAAAR